MGKQSEFEHALIDSVGFALLDDKENEQQRLATDDAEGGDDEPLKRSL